MLGCQAVQNLRMSFSRKRTSSILTQLPGFGGDDQGAVCQPDFLLEQRKGTELLGVRELSKNKWPQQTSLEQQCNKW